MLVLLKKYLPRWLKALIIRVKQKTYDQWQKKSLFKKMQIKHAELLQQVKGKKSIKVVFLVIHESVWKVDPVFRKMLAGPFFEPEILVCPYTAYGEERMLEDMEKAYSYFIKKGYPVRKSRKKDGTWVELKEVSPDVIFFTNPHNVTIDKYYEKAYLNYLSCYVPYAHDVSKYNNYDSQYNQPFHNAMWRIFAPHYEDLEIFSSYSIGKGNNVTVTGYPSCETLLEPKQKSPWKPQGKNKLKVIWAPHHTINDPNLPYSNFLQLAEFFQRISQELRDEAQFAFKPHPILKSKLDSHDDWGVLKTNNYYNYWKESKNTQLEEGDYAELFKWSDCMIHDSGSFLAEYHYVKKPVFYISDETIVRYLNPFGVSALKSCFVGKDEECIRNFIEKVGKNKLDANASFYETKLEAFFRDKTPSESILLDIQKLIS